MTADELSQLEFINRYTARHTPCHCAESEILVALMKIVVSHPIYAKTTRVNVI
jgi:hypothetical protein